MKQMFTVTKERERHTFIETVVKICMVMDYAMPFPEEGITDLVMRSWSTDPAEQENPLIRTISQKVAAARSHGKSLQLGQNIRMGQSVAQLNYELLNVESGPGVAEYSLFRISLVNITLVQSDTLPNPVQPVERCPKFFQNEATGGRLRGTNCFVSPAPNQTNAHFFGQVDTSAILIMSGLLGDGGANLSEKALDQHALEWSVKNGDRLDKLVLSRGFIVALDPSLVMVEISKIQAAISYLQITLVILAAVFGSLSWICLKVFGGAHYSSSLLANLYATTGVDGCNTSQKPGYITKMPEIQLSETESKIRMETGTGVFRHDYRT
jgi:hypothetical protein